MAESFSNKVGRAVGVVTTSTGASIGITTNKITGVSTAGVSVGDLVDVGSFLGGTKVSSIGVGIVTCNRDSTNSVSVTSQTVKFMAPTTLYTSPASTKTILIGGNVAVAIPINVAIPDATLQEVPTGWDVNDRVGPLRSSVD